jgi:allantoicase
MFPDGGTARLRVYGEVHVNWKVKMKVLKPFATALTHLIFVFFCLRFYIYIYILRHKTLIIYQDGNLVDLAAFEHGGIAISCSDEHFGKMRNLGKHEKFSFRSLELRRDFVL